MPYVSKDTTLKDTSKTETNMKSSTRGMIVVFYQCCVTMMGRQ